MFILAHLFPFVGLFFPLAPLSLIDTAPGLPPTPSDLGPLSLILESVCSLSPCISTQSSHQLQRTTKTRWRRGGCPGLQTYATEDMHFVTLDGLKATSAQVTQSEEPVRDLRMCVCKLPRCTLFFIAQPSCSSFQLSLHGCFGLLNRRLSTCDICPSFNITLFISSCESTSRPLVGKTCYLRVDIGSNAPPLIPGTMTPVSRLSEREHVLAMYVHWRSFGRVGQYLNIFRSAFSLLW